MGKSFALPIGVSINQSRYNVRIVVVDREGKEHIFIATADDGIWFGTQEEYNQEFA